MNFGYGPAGRGEAAAADAVELRLVLRHVREHRRVPAAYAELDGGPSVTQPLDRWLVARTRAARRARRPTAYDALLDAGVDRAFEASSTISRTGTSAARARASGPGDAAAFRTLWYALVQTLRLVAPRDAVPRRGSSGGTSSAAPARARRSRCTSPAGRRPPRPTSAAGRDRGGARASSGSAARHATRRASSCASRCGGSSSPGAAGGEAHVDEICEELRVKEVEIARRGADAVSYKPNLRVLGPRLGKDLPAVRDGARAGDFEELGAAGCRAAGQELGPTICSSSAPGATAGPHAAASRSAIDLELDAELLLEGRVLRPDPRGQRDAQGAGLELTDRIVLTMPDPRRSAPSTRSGSRRRCSQSRSGGRGAEMRSRRFLERGSEPSSSALEARPRPGEEVADHRPVALRLLDHGRVRAVLEHDAPRRRRFSRRARAATASVDMS